jgi:hypothetical protein
MIVHIVITRLVITITLLFSCTALACEQEQKLPKRPSLIRSASSSMRHYLTLWPDDLVEILLKAYSDTHGFQEGTYFGRAQMISDAIHKESGKSRSASEIRRKLASLGKMM